jgi:elongation factor 2
MNGDKISKFRIPKNYLSADKVRNFCIIAHVDHGKSTLADWLISSAKIISTQPGRRYLDSRPDEQERGITISSASISFVLNEHVFNLIDSPGHVDFGGNVTSALRACDGALLLVDAVEGMMPQTIAVLKQALKEKVIPVLVINKIDRLFCELKLTSEVISKKILTLIENINLFIESIDSSCPNFAFKKGNVILAAGLEGWAINLTRTNYTLKHVLEAYEQGTANELKNKLPLAEVISSTIIECMPSPIIAQNNKLKTIAPHIDAETLIPLIECNPVSKITGVVTSVAYSRDKGRMSIVRLFSGTIKKGSILYNPQEPDQPMTVSRLYLTLGKQLEEYDQIPAGMIVCIVGLNNVIIGSTVSSDPKFPVFEELKHSAEPVMSISFRPKEQANLNRLKELLIQECHQDLTLKYIYDSDSKEHILKGLGKLHLEVVLNKIMRQQKIELVLKEPSVIYLEAPTENSSKIETVTSNKLNKFQLSVKTIDEDTLKILNDHTNILKIPYYTKLFDKSPFKEYAKNIVAIEGTNMLIDVTKSVQFMHESIPNLILGFNRAIQRGPLIKRAVINTAVFLHDASWHVDFVHRTPQDIAPPAAKTIHQCMIEAKTVIKEPYIKTFITVPIEYLGNITKQVKVRKGKVLETDYTSQSVTITAILPVKDSFNLSEQLMKSAEGQLSWRYELDEYRTMSKEDMNELIETVRKQSL